MSAGVLLVECSAGSHEGLHTVDRIVLSPDLAVKQPVSA